MRPFDFLKQRCKVKKERRNALKIIHSVFIINH